MDKDRLLELAHRQARTDALILLDERERIVAWLMGAELIFGRAAEEMLGRSLHPLFTPEDQENRIPENELENARRTGTSENDRWMMRRDNVRFWATGFVHCLREDDGRIAGYAKILRDRTDLRGQYEALRNRAEALAEEERRTALLLGILAHELRNPLSAMSNAVQLIEFTYPKDPKLTYALQVLNRQVDYVSALIEDLIDVARVRTGKAELSYETIEVGSLVGHALETVAAQLRKNRQKVEVLQPPMPIALEGDRVRLTQVLVNLLGNAAKFSDAGANIWIKSTVEGDEAVIRIEDHGRGISPSLLPHVFELLNQANAPAEQRQAGLGLGLSIVREYVELHGGTVQVRSEGVGLGSEFTVRLPLRRRR